MGRPRDTEKHAKLYSVLQKEIRKANQRIDRIEKNFGEDSWAVKRLKPKLEIEKLNAINERGHVQIRKDMTIAELRNVLKSVRQFNNSETATVRGIKDVRKRTIDTLSKSLNESLNPKNKPKLNISYDEAEVLYDVLKDKDYKWIFEEKKGDTNPSDFWNLVETYVNKNYSKQQVVDDLARYVKNNKNWKDTYYTAKLTAIYNNIVEPIKKSRQ